MRLSVNLGQRALWVGLILAGGIGMAQRVSAKRAAPANISPLVAGEARIRPVFERHEADQRREYSVSLVAEYQDGRGEIWRVRLYEREYRVELEGDVQEIHLKSLAMLDDVVVAVDERQQTYKLNVKSGARLQPKSVIKYPKAL